jgi:hypothetical protein
VFAFATWQRRHCFYDPTIVSPTFRHEGTVVTLPMPFSCRGRNGTIS